MGKLVRDKIPEILSTQGISHTVRRIDGVEFHIELIKKLFEKSKEVYKAFKEGNREKILQEIADVVEVLYTIASTKGITAVEIEKARFAKSHLRGRYVDKIYLEMKS